MISNSYFRGDSCHETCQWEKWSCCGYAPSILLVNSDDFSTFSQNYGESCYMKSCWCILTVSLTEIKTRGEQWLFFLSAVRKAKPSKLVKQSTLCHKLISLPINIGSQNVPRYSSLEVAAISSKESKQPPSCRRKKSGTHPDIKNKQSLCQYYDLGPHGQQSHHISHHNWDPKSFCSPSVTSTHTVTIPLYWKTWDQIFFSHWRSLLFNHLPSVAKTPWKVNLQKMSDIISNSRLQ